MHNDILIVYYISLLQVGFARDGKLLALDMKLYSNAGNSVDLSLSVSHEMGYNHVLYNYSVYRLWIKLSCIVKMLITFLM